MIPTAVAWTGARLALRRAALASVAAGRRPGALLAAPAAASDPPRRLMADSPPPWNYLWQPGPYPKTKEAREAAARKYGLIPEDYEPYPDDGDGLGDYPNLKPSSADSRSGHVDWDMPEDRRNFGEPLRYEYDMTTETRYDDTTRMIRSDLYHWMVFITCIGSYLALFLLSGIHGFFRPVAEEQLPYKEKGKVKTFYEFHVEKPE